MATVLKPKVCVKCEQPGVFSPHYRKTCNKCIGIQYRESMRKNRLKRVYGITQEQYEEIYTAQDGCCAICDDFYPLLVIDHCHSSGKVRGLLCVTCNAGLGSFKDTPQLMIRAIGYLDACND